MKLYMYYQEWAEKNYGNVDVCGGQTEERDELNETMRILNRKRKLATEISYKLAI